MPQIFSDLSIEHDVHPVPSQNKEGVSRNSLPSSGGNATPQLVLGITLEINGNLDSMAESWTQEESSNRRRIVMFHLSRTGSTLTANIRPVPVEERPPNSICISCIWWAEKGECYVTSTDTIYLLERLAMGPTRFGTWQKHRIRRYLAEYRPLTVWKRKKETEEFFKLIMAFPNPKPLNIERDVKVFPWKILESALRKVIRKGILSQPGDHHSQYSIHSSHHDAIPSPRLVPGFQPTYTTSWSYRHQPTTQHPPPVRINTNPLPAVRIYETGTVSTSGCALGMHTPVSQHPLAATPPRWGPAPASYADSFSPVTSYDYYLSNTAIWHTTSMSFVGVSADEVGGLEWGLERREVLAESPQGLGP